jgi:hypothetical protein
MLTRRNLLVGAGAIGLIPQLALAASLRAPVTVHKDPSCGCCGAWVDYLRQKGFTVAVKEDPAINVLKGKLGVPSGVMSCHTAELGGYVLEGHVPVAAIEKLLSETPAIRGLAVPGMPAGSPGMEVEGVEPEVYDVMAFGAGKPSVFMRFRGRDPA